MPDASNAKYHSAEHIFASGIGPSNNKFQSNVQPIKLNFEEEKADQQVKDMDVRQSGMSNQYSGNLAMANIPSLKDLQTSNLFTDQFQGDDAEYYAMQNINDEQHLLMQKVRTVLEKNGDQTTFRKLMAAPELGGATKQNATSVFMSLLTYG